MVKDVTEATFQQDVVERSKEVPVVVDFWAEWCGPCRALTPIIEKAVAERAGKVELEFVGVQPPPAVARFLDGLIPSEADALVAEGGEAQLRRALELEPGRADAAVALARLLLARDERDEALAMLQNAHGFAAEGLAARIRLEAEHPEAFAKLDAGDTEGALDELIEATAQAQDKEPLRQVIVGVLDELGVEHPLARESRRKLAAALY